MSVTFSGRLPGPLPAPLPAPLPTPGPSRPVRRVRHEVRDSLVVIGFSAAASTLIALVLTTLLQMAG